MDKTEEAGSISQELQEQVMREGVEFISQKLQNQYLRELIERMMEEGWWMSKEGQNLFWPSDPPRDRNLEELVGEGGSHQETQVNGEFWRNQNKGKTEGDPRRYATRTWASKVKKSTKIEEKEETYLIQEPQR